VLGQISVNPTVPPTLNSGGWVYGAAVLLGVLGILFTLAVVFGYMRLAPRFQTDEETRKRVRVPRMQPGKEVRRPVNVSGVPLLVQAPVVAVAVASPASVAPGPATLAAPSAAPIAPPAPVAVATAPPETTAPAAQEAAAPLPAASAPAEAGAPAAVAPAPAAAPAAAEHKEVALDQETFDRVLAELLEKGTDRRVAEGQARRAAMIAARKKAEG